MNEPVSFGGLTLYQSSYGCQSTGPVRLKVQLGRPQESIEAPLRQPMDLPGGRGKIIPMKVDGNFQGYGPAVLLAFSSGSGHPEVFWILKDHPEMGKQPGPYRFTVESIPFGYYSVFQVKRDPGVGWVYAGFLLFLPGLYLAFFRPAERWAVVLAKTPKGEWQGRLLGASPRDREEFAARQERLLMELKRRDPIMISQILGVRHVDLSFGGHPLPDGGVVVVSPASECRPVHPVAGLGIHTGALIGRWVESYQMAAAHYSHRGLRRTNSNSSLFRCRCPISMNP